MVDGLDYGAQGHTPRHGNPRPIRGVLRTGGGARLGAPTELMGVFDVEPATLRVRGHLDQTSLDAGPHAEFEEATAR